MSTENPQHKAVNRTGFFNSIFGRLRSFRDHFNTSKPGGKRNVIIMSYALAFLGLHTIWVYSKGFKDDKTQAIE